MSSIMEPADDDEILTDVCVIGAGPAGLTLAREFDRHGVRTCLLESGGLEIEKGIQRQSRGESDGYPIHHLDYCRVRALGGTLRHPRIVTGYWAARPLDPVDFEAPPIPSGIGWPFDRAALERYYLRAIQTCGLRTESEAIAWWSAHAPHGAKEATSGELSAAVFQFTDTALQESWSPLMKSDHVEVLLHTRAVNLAVGRDGARVEQVIAVRGPRERVSIRPRVVVLATGAIENARLLLLGDGGRALGNEHDLVGRYFAERLSFHAGRFTPAQDADASGFALLHRPADYVIGGGIRLTDQEQRAHSLRNCVFFLVPRPVAVLGDGIRSLSTLRKILDRRPIAEGVGHHLRNLPSAAGPLMDVALGRALSRPQALALRVQGEPSPNPDSRVRLGTRRDDLDLPVARVTWRIAPDDYRDLRASADAVDEVLRARGLGSLQWDACLEDSTTLVEGNHHHLGTTRMHPDPRKGVVDADGRVHSVENLFVAGSSVFPRYGASNPTLTIIALAHRLADHIRTTTI